MKGIFIPANLTDPIREVEVEEAYPDVNNIINQDGRDVWIEIVHSPLLHALVQPEYDPFKRTGGTRLPSLVMVVDEEGVSKQLGLNSRASQLYDPANHGYIFGDAVVFGEAETEAGVDLVDVPEKITVEMIEVLGS